MAKTATAAKSNAPVFTMRRKGVSVSVFENQTADGKTFFKTSLQRTYKDEGGDFKSVNSYSRDDHPVAILLLQKAWEFILETEAANRKEEE